MKLTVTMAIAALMLGFSMSSNTLAVQTDRDQPVRIEADRLTVDDRNKTHTFEGSVVLTQGSLEIRGDKMIVTQGADGFQTGIATGTPDRLARFRQRRDDSDVFIEGEAERIEYDTRAERARLFKQARVSSGGDVVTGDFIEYDALTEKYSATNKPGGTGDGRVRAVIQPRNAGDGAQ